MQFERELVRQGGLLMAGCDGDFAHDASAIRKPELVFKQGVGWDSAKLRASVAGSAGAR
jgi:hypothetical protein